MSYTSLGFLLFTAIVVAAYFLMPARKYRWAVLLAASWFFYLYTSLRGSAYILFTTVTTYAAALAIDRQIRASKQTLKEKKGEWDRETRKRFKKTVERRKRLILAAVLLCNFGILAFLKYYNFGVESLSRLMGLASLSDHTLRLLLPLGISFYTFQAMGYVIDVSREQAEAERNILKLSLYISFFPQIVQGPVGVYGELAHQLYEPHDFDFTRFKYGCELMLWGFFKKLVIADRAVIAVNAAMEGGAILSFNGTTILFTLLIYALQLYTDFSGGIDISRGIAQILGIDMAINFRQPFFAVSVSDFWRRWHISLGNWMKNYLFYPIALSDRALTATNRLLKTRFAKTPAGEHIVRVMFSCIASLIVFLVVGVWHGAEWKCVAYGLYNGVIIAAATLLSPVFKWQNQKLHISPGSRLLKLFRIARTFVLTLVGFLFDLIPGVRSFPQMLGRIILQQDLAAARLEIRDGLSLLLSEYVLLAAGAAIVFAVGILRELRPERSLRQALDRRPYLLRSTLIFACVMVILVYGVYGGEYDAASFVYMQF